ncbi:DnaJ-domain-containing protein [Paxillus ammoniavirescens]|nr:DnaJ-domain-containing protein [Paxillus ammoniavirescens]
MDNQDPISHFFPGEDDVDLYAVLGLKSVATPEDVRKSYRKLALQYHPDKHTNSTEEERGRASKQFHKIGFAYAVLSDEKRRKNYDRTGTTGEDLGVEAGEDGGWEAYFEDLFDRVTRGRLDEMKKEYQGSSEEVEDLKAAYHQTQGSLGEIMKNIPHSTTDDEPRFIHTISKLIAQGELPDLQLWQSTSKDEKAKLVRKKQTDKEAKEAEELAKRLGVWDEFYGSGKVGARKGKGKEKEKKQGGDDEDVSGLQALILQRQKARNGFLDGLAAKYTDMEEAESSKKKGGKGKKRKKVTETSEAEEVESPKKRFRSAPEPPEIDDEEFARIRSELSSNKAKPSGASTTATGKKATRAKKAK